MQHFQVIKAPSSFAKIGPQKAVVQKVSPFGPHPQELQESFQESPSDLNNFKIYHRQPLNEFKELSALPLVSITVNASLLIFPPRVGSREVDNSTLLVVVSCSRWLRHRGHNQLWGLGAQLKLNVAEPPGAPGDKSLCASASRKEIESDKKNPHKILLAFAFLHIKMASCFVKISPCSFI